MPTAIPAPEAPRPVDAPAPPVRTGAMLHRRRVPILVAAAVFLLFSAVWGTGAFARLSGGGFETPGSESLAAAETEFGRDGIDVAVVYTSDTLSVDDPAFRNEVERTLAALPADAVAAVTTTWSTGSPVLASIDRRQALVLVQLAGDEQAHGATYRRIADALVAGGGLRTHRGGSVPTVAAINDRISADLARAEALSAPVLLVLLVVVFGGLVAAGLPLLIGGIAILGAFTALRAISYATTVSVFSVNIVTMLGLGLAVDYSLLVVSRFREELRARGATRAGVPAALDATMATAGRSVLFSGVTVAVSLSALLFFPQPFLRSMGFGSIAAVLVALAAALTVLPALLAVLGPRIDALRLRRPRSSGASADRGDDGGWWALLARAVMRRPALVAAGVTALLLLLAFPATRITFGGTDHRVLPAGTESRVAAELLVAGFPDASTNDLDVVVRGASPAQLESFAAELAAVEGVPHARVAGTSGDSALITVALPANPDLESQLVAAVRAAPAPDGTRVLVGGAAAEEVDTLAALAHRLPWAAAFVTVVTLVLLFLAFGSVLLPIKAVLMAGLSLASMFGVLVWIFQDGNLASYLGVTVTGTVEATQPVIMVAVAFGLSMDYEVFLLARVREEWDRTHDNARAVALGMQRTGRIITSAALLLVVVIGAFATSGISLITMTGVGLAVAILLDATVIRALLVPATMHLLGRANWWAPVPLLRLRERWGSSVVTGHLGAHGRPGRLHPHAFGDEADFDAGDGSRPASTRRPPTHADPMSSTNPGISTADTTGGPHLRPG